MKEIKSKSVWLLEPNNYYQFHVIPKVSYSFTFKPTAYFRFDNNSWMWQSLQSQFATEKRQITQSGENHNLQRTNDTKSYSLCSNWLADESI